MTDLALMGALERAVARNLADFVAVYDGEAMDCIEIAGGVAAFTGIESPLTTVKGAGPRLSPRDLDDIESFFRGHHAASATIEMAPWLTAESRQLLGVRGYHRAGEEDVVVATAPLPFSDRVLRVETIPAAEWVELLSSEPAANALIEASVRLSDAQLYGVRDDGRWIAGAQSVTYDDVVIVGNDETVPEARRRGAQTALIQERVRAVPPGTIVMAEVAPESGSERNYLRCGFAIAYARTHYVRPLS